MLPRWAVGFSLVPWLLTASAQDQTPNCCESEAETLPQRQVEALVEKTESILAPCCGDMLHIKGTIVLAISVDSDGDVTCVKVISGHPLLFGVTIESVKHWKFRPYTLQGVKKGFCGQLALRLEANDYSVKYNIVLTQPMDLQATNSRNPYPNELRRFKFYAKHLAPLRPYLSDRNLVISVLGDSTGVDLSRWRIRPFFVAEGGNINGHPWAKDMTGQLASISGCV